MLASALVVAYALWLALAVVPGNVDVSWLIVVCGRILSGERLYVDIVETNPPFSVALYMPFVLLERLAGGRAETWLAAGVTAFALAGVALSARILARGDAFWRDPASSWLAPLALFLVLAFFPGEFGQREHFATIAILPWAALQCARAASPDFRAGTAAERLLAGLCAAVVVMVKPPHFALAIVLPSLMLAVGRRSFRPLLVTENLVGAGLSAAYVAYVALAHRTFLTDMLPLVTDIYLPLRAPLAGLLANWPKTVLLLALATALAAGGIRAMHADARIAFMAALGFVPAFLVMGKGWPNHAWPMVTMAILAFAVQAMRQRPAPPFLAKAGLAFGCVMALQMAARPQIAELTEDRGPLVRTVAAIRHAVERPTMVSLDTRPQSAFPLARLVDARFVSRHPAGWAVYHAEALARLADDPARRARLQAIRDGVIAELAAEIETKWPDVVVYGVDPDGVWDDVMLRAAPIAAALRGYAVLSREPTATIYLRRDPAAGPLGEAPLRGTGP